MVTICRLPTHGNNCYGTNPNFTEKQSYGIFQILSVTNNKKEGNDTVNKEFCFKNSLTVSIRVVRRRKKPYQFVITYTILYVFDIIKNLVMRLATSCKLVDCIVCLQSGF